MCTADMPAEITQVIGKRKKVKMKQSTLKAILSKIQHALFLVFWVFFFNESSKSLESKEHSMLYRCSLTGQSGEQNKGSAF